MPVKGSSKRSTAERMRRASQRFLKKPTKNLGEEQIKNFAKLREKAAPHGKSPAQLTPRPGQPRVKIPVSQPSVPVTHKEGHVSPSRQVSVTIALPDTPKNRAYAKQVAEQQASGSYKPIRVQTTSPRKVARQESRKTVRKQTRYEVKENPSPKDVKASRAGLTKEQRKTVRQDVRRERRTGKTKHERKQAK